MAKRKDSANYFIIHRWMVENLNFENTAECVVFAFVYGLCKSNNVFRGSAQYLADWAICSVSTIRRAVKSLERKKYISIEYGRCPNGKCWILKPLIEGAEDVKGKEKFEIPEEIESLLKDFLADESCM